MSDRSKRNSVDCLHKKMGNYSDLFEMTCFIDLSIQEFADRSVHQYLDDDNTNEGLSTNQWPYGAVVDVTLVDSRRNSSLLRWL